MTNPSGHRNKRKDDEYRSSLKSMDTEEWWDLHFYRPIGYGWACLARRLGVSPNTITIASIFLGIGSGWCFYYDNLWWNLLGAILLIWADSFDSADGQLARMTGKYSRLGRILDGLSGDLWFAAIYIAICLRENDTSPFFSANPWLIWVTAAVTGICHASQAALADYYRQFHLFMLKGLAGSELENTDDIKAKYQSLKWSHEAWPKLVLFFYMNYSIRQEKQTPRMQKLRLALRERFGNEIPLEFRADFRKESLPLMKYTNILSFNTRSFALFIAILIFSQPWIYFAFELTVLNIIMIYMKVRHERICNNFLDNIDKYREMT